MLLKSKLLLGFLVMLLLTVATAFTGWKALDDIEYQSNVVNRVENALTMMVVAQVQQLELLRTRDASLVGEANKSIDESLQSVIAARELMLRPENRAAAQKAVDFLTWYKPAFKGLVDNEAQRYRDDATVVESTRRISAIMTQLVDGIEKAIRGGNTSTAALDSYRAVVDAQQAFTLARLSARAFTAVPSAQTGQQAAEQIRLAFRSMTSAAGTLRLPENVALAREGLTLLQDYERKFQALFDSTLKSDAITREVDRKLTESVDNMRQLSTMAMNTIMTTKSSGNTRGFAVTIFSLLAGFGIAFFLAGNVQKQLGKDPSLLANIAQRVTDGDYNIDDGSPRRGVYGNLVAMVASLREHIENAQQESARAHEESKRAQEAMLKAEQAEKEAEAKAQAMLVAADKLEEVAHVLSSASGQLSAQIEMSERGAAEQAARVGETATAMEQMNSTVLEVARNAGRASEVSATTRQKAEGGAQVVREAVASIQEVQAQSLQLKADMGALGENAQSINQIMGVISDIADQTNLLALNAAIEAARAGEAGRGFAVVADEVRKLAEKTMQSTTDVGNAIRAIQTSAGKSMEQVDAAVHTIEKATALATQSGGALVEIVQMVDNTADQVRAIATAAEEQSASSEAINQSIAQVNAIAAETSRAMQEAARAVSDLSEQAHTLSGLIEDMKRG